MTQEEHVSTAEVTEIDQGRQLKLPRFDKYRVPQARLSFGGALELSLTSTEDVELVEALALGATGTVVFSVDGVEREVTLGWRCTGRAHRFRKLDGDEGVVGTHRIVINDVRDGDDDPEDD